MSKQAESFIADWLGKSRIPQDCERRRVLQVLAEAHLEGPLSIETMAVAKKASIGAYAVWLSVFALHEQGALSARNLGGQMTIDFPFNYPTDHPAYVHVSPDAQEAAR